jgi:hypothetical protein
MVSFGNSATTVPGANPMARGQKSFKALYLIDNKVITSSSEVSEAGRSPPRGYDFDRSVQPSFII